MAAVTPSTDLYLLQCPIEIDNRNQINFSNATNQYNYFFNLYKIGATNFSYQRKDSTIRYPAHIDSIRHFNYCMYRNDNYSNKWFYAFIEKMEYLNDTTTLITIKTDVYQTWQFDLTFKRSFVVREHTNDDTVGANTVPESLETGEYICNATTMWEYAHREYMICMQVSDVPQAFNIGSITSKYYNRIINGCWVLGFSYNSAGVTSMNKVLKWYDSNQKGDAIVALYLVPKGVIGWNDQNFPLSSTSQTTVYVPYDSSWSTIMGYQDFGYSGTLDSYTPRNNKLLTYPYNYFSISNCNGDVYTYRYEDFNGTPRFECDGCLGQNGPVRAFPTNSKKMSMNPVSGWDYGITAGKYPILSWISDYYLNWQAQNSKYIEKQTEINRVSMASNIAQSLINFDLGGAIGSGTNFASQMLAFDHQREVAQMTPDQAKGNVNNGDLNFSFGADRFVFRQMCVRAEYARIIDDYFTAVGYQTNRVKVPNITGRRNWNYVQTQGCNIIANIPQEDLEEIKSLFDTGITIWHNTSTFLDYSQNNPIV